MDKIVCGNLTKTNIKTNLIEVLYFICDFEKETFGWKEDSHSEYYIEIFAFEEIRDIIEKTYNRDMEDDVQKIFQFIIDIQGSKFILTTMDQNYAQKWSKCFKRILSKGTETDIQFKNSTYDSNTKDNANNTEEKPREDIISESKNTEDEPKKAKTEPFKTINLVRNASSESLHKESEKKALIKPEKLKKLDMSDVFEASDQCNSEYNSNEKKRLYITNDLLNWNYYDHNLKPVNSDMKVNKTLKLDNLDNLDNLHITPFKLYQPAKPRKSISDVKNYVQRKPIQQNKLNLQNKPPLVENIVTIKYTEEEQKKFIIKLEEEVQKKTITKPEEEEPKKLITKPEEAKDIDTKSFSSTLSNTKYGKSTRENFDNNDTYLNTINDNSGSLSDESYSSLRSNSYERILAKKVKTATCPEHKILKVTNNIVESETDDCDISFKKKDYTMKIKHTQKSEEHTPERKKFRVIKNIRKGMGVSIRLDTCELNNQ
jgi:hypothetical protein